ncbi:MAG: nuclease [Oxalobacteraceae bacterium]|jgi:UvrD-like helicase C-terminal domain/Nuclease-related domain/AAA domain|nr:nuclease [Oxalobacteraceae bacterium]
MAHIQPEGWRDMSVTGAAQREIETLMLLSQALPDEYTIFHGVHWTQLDKIGQAFSVYGEIDFIVLSPEGRLLLIEQKSGFLAETDEGLAKRYPGLDKPKLVKNQILRSVSALRQRFGNEGEKLSIDYLLYCPDYQVKRIEAAGLAADRIVDARQRDRLPSIIQTILPAAAATAQRERVQRFLNNVLQLVPDPSAMIGQANALVTRLSGGLATWARQLDFSPFRLRVQGTAGSGKTQLALAEFSDALAAGKKPLYVCYNRPLADHVRRLLPSGGQVASFHQLCDSFARATGMTPDYRDQTMWQALEEHLGSAALTEEWRFDTLIVDEGQDFSERWRDALLRMLNPEGRALWMEDPMQNLYGRAPVTLPAWVTLRSNANYRSPRQIIAWLTALSAEALSVEAASPFGDSHVDLLIYPDKETEKLHAQTLLAITRCLGASFKRQDIALISFRGRENSQLLNLDALGNHQLKSFSGQYDLFGNPLFREGDLLAESVYRFKGQSAPAVIFTEIDFAELDEKSFRKLFVGMTRARLKLVMVISERAAKVLQARL